MPLRVGVGLEISQFESAHGSMRPADHSVPNSAIRPQGRNQFFSLWSLRAAINSWLVRHTRRSRPSAAQLPA